MYYMLILAEEHCRCHTKHIILQTKQQIQQQTKQQTNEQTNKQTNEQTNEQTNQAAAHQEMHQCYLAILNAKGAGSGREATITQQYHTSCSSRACPDW